MKALMTGVAAAALLCAPALANDRGNEFRFGVSAHDIVNQVEDGPNIAVEFLFASPDALDFIWEPRPFIYGSFNTNELTNYGAAGLAWDIPMGDRWHFEFKTGLSYNDGVTDIDQNAPPGDPNRIRLSETRMLLGNHWLFYNQIGVDYDLNENWAVGAFYEHASHGQILASGRNQAIDTLGIRLGYRWGE